MKNTHIKLIQLQLVSQGAYSLTFFSLFELFELANISRMVSSLTAIYALAILPVCVY